METLACPSCESPGHRTVLENCRDLVCRCPGEWRLAECTKCRLVYTVPVMDQDTLLTYYPLDYGPYNPSGGSRANRLLAIVRWMLMSPYRLRFGSPDFSDLPFHGGRLLDVGCGSGMFLRQAGRLGWRCWGIDFNAATVEKARANAPEATLSAGTLDDVATTPAFDLINMTHVLEHLARPRQVLRQCLERLAPGGKLRLGVPNIGSIEAKVFGRYWIGLDVPRHVVHFRPSVLARLLEETGFVDVELRPAMLASSISESLMLTLPGALRYRLLGSRWARGIYLSMIFPASMSYAVGNAGAIEVTARRP
jgi:2-polyprenyl-3-methyl-5-hydroxy-6-metoxy-1,4-benzoquinol methylase